MRVAQQLQEEQEQQDDREELEEELEELQEQVEELTNASAQMENQRDILSAETVSRQREGKIRCYQKIYSSSFLCGAHG